MKQVKIHEAFSIADPDHHGDLRKEFLDIHNRVRELWNNARKYEVCDECLYLIIHHVLDIKVDTPDDLALCKDHMAEFIEAETEGMTEC